MFKSYAPPFWAKPVRWVASFWRGLQCQRRGHLSPIARQETYGNLVPRCPRCRAWRSPYDHPFSLAPEAREALRGKETEWVVASHERSGWWVWSLRLRNDRTHYSRDDFTGRPPPSIEWAQMGMDP